jgi:hypothetical protein
MPKHRNKKKTSSDETPYPLFDPLQSTRGKKDGSHDTKSNSGNKKPMSNDKTKQKTHATSGAKKNAAGKYSSYDDLISTERSITTDNWKFVHREEFGKNIPFTADDLMGEGDSAHNLASYIQTIDDEQAPPNSCLSVKFWRAATTVVFDDEQDEFNTETGKKMRYLLLRLAISNPKVLFQEEWKGDHLRSTNVTCAWGASTAFFGSHYLEKSNHYHKKSTVLDNDDVEIVKVTKAPPARMTIDSYANMEHSEKYTTSDATIEVKRSESTQQWTHVNKEEFDKLQLQPFTTDDLMGEGESAHNLASNIHAIDEGQAPSGHCYNAKYWFAVAKAVFDKDSEDFDTIAGKKVRLLLMKLAASDPKVLFTGEWKGTMLRSSQVTCAWKAATDFFGSQYANKTLVNISMDLSSNDNGTTPPRYHCQCHTRKTQSQENSPQNSLQNASS